MAFHLFVFLFAVSLLFLSLLWRLCWFPLRLSSSQGVAKHSKLPRSLCPAAQTIARPVVSPLLLRWVESLLLHQYAPGLK
jgi:hypothetical protein